MHAETVMILVEQQRGMRRRGRTDEFESPRDDNVRTPRTRSNGGIAKQIGASNHGNATATDMDSQRNAQVPETLFG